MDAQAARMLPAPGGGCHCERHGRRRRVWLNRATTRSPRAVWLSAFPKTGAPTASALYRACQSRREVLKVATGGCLSSCADGEDVGLALEAVAASDGTDSWLFLDKTNMAGPLLS